ncbi:MAG: 50S ribosomal protein L18 [Candidatus Omnitrophica bacterium]|nr:50S ribosomal protein L18 [Candidatus Omnitrophota bacterium]
MKNREHSRVKRHKGLRKKIFGTSERPRLSVHRSLKNLYCQVINDEKSKTLFSFSTQDKGFVKSAGKLSKQNAAAKLGKFFAAQLKEKGIRKIAFDRGGLIYHGRIKAVAESLRQEGIEF